MKLPKLETLVIAVFLVCVGMWAMSKCSARRSDFVRQNPDLTEEQEDLRAIRRDSVAARQRALPSTPVPQTQAPVTTPTAATPNSGVAATPTKAPSRPNLSAPAVAPPSAPVAQTATGGKSTLYVTIDGLKVRSEPSLKSTVVDKLELYEPVTFLNKKTEWTQEISLGTEKVTDHWVRIRTKSGKEGWVFGAGVHYYKMKRKGVQE